MIPRLRKAITSFLTFSMLSMLVSGQKWSKPIDPNEYKLNPMESPIDPESSFGNGEPPGLYLETCKVVSARNGILQTKCVVPGRSGKVRWDTLDLSRSACLSRTDIINVLGKPMCITVDPSKEEETEPPEGSYLESCEVVKSTTSVLIARCPRTPGAKDGRMMRESKLYLKSPECLMRSDIFQDNGHLACDRMVPIPWLGNLSPDGIH